MREGDPRDSQSAVRPAEQPRRHARMRHHHVRPRLLQHPPQTPRARKEGQRIFGLHVQFDEMAAVHEHPVHQAPPHGHHGVVEPRLHERAVHLHDAAFDAALVHRRHKLQNFHARILSYFPSPSRPPPSATSHPPPATSHKPQATRHRPPATRHQPPATSHKPPATSHQPPATSHQPSSAPPPDMVNYPP